MSANSFVGNGAKTIPHTVCPNLSHLLLKFLGEHFSWVHACPLHRPLYDGHLMEQAACRQCTGIGADRRQAPSTRAGNMRCQAGSVQGSACMQGEGERGAHPTMRGSSTSSTREPFPKVRMTRPVTTCSRARLCSVQGARRGSCSIKE